MMTEETSRPNVRILHTLARSGGTLVGKCIGSMDNVVLFSEIHPAIICDMSIVEQAHKWFNLFSPEDIQWLINKQKVEFREAVSLICERCEERDMALVIRDWSYIDFVGIPFWDRPTCRLTMADVLNRKFSLFQACLVRHPIDQWLSLKRLRNMENVTLDMFLHGYFRFTEHCAEIGFIRYEDFTKFPERQMNLLCEYLNLDFDPGFMERWANYTNITGDIYGAGRGGTEIQPLPMRDIDSSLIAMFEKNNDYIRSLELLGYEHPEI